MNINNAIDAASSKIDADAQALQDKDAQIATLTAAANTASANLPDPVKTKALVDKILGADSATLP